MTDAIAWPEADAYAAAGKGRPKPHKAAPPDLALSVSAGDKPGLVTLSVAPALWRRLGWTAGCTRLRLAVHASPHATFLRLVERVDGDYAVRKSPRATVAGEEGRLIVALGRPHGLALAPRRVDEREGVAWRLCGSRAQCVVGPDGEWTDVADALEICIDAPADPDPAPAAVLEDDASPGARPPQPAGSSARTLGSQATAERAATTEPPVPPRDRRSARISAEDPDKAARRAAAAMLEVHPPVATASAEDASRAKATARSLAAVGQTAAFIIREIGRVHGLAVDGDWLVEVLRAPPGSRSRVTAEGGV